MNFRDEIDKKSNLWMIKENEGLTNEEELELEKWLENQQHKDSFDENKKVIEECLTLDDDFIKELEDEVFKEKNIFLNTKYIAASVIIVCISIFGMFEYKNYIKPSFVQDYVSLEKKMLHISLPDDTIVDLDVKSNIQVSYYKNKRTVILNNGTALFSVSKNKDKPFLIKSGSTSIEVLGTKFEVINTNNRTKVNVLEGLVRVDYIYNDEGDKRALLQLKKSESLTINNKGKVLDYGKIDIKDIANWRNDIIIFKQTTLKEAGLLFEKYSNQKILFENYELSQLTISGKFSTSHYNSFLEAIQLIYPIKVQKEGKNIKFTKF